MLRKASRFIAEKYEGGLRVTISGRQAGLDKALLALWLILTIPFALCFALTWIASLTPAKIATLNFWISIFVAGFLLLSLTQATLQVVWDASGKETIELGERRLQLQKRLLGVTFSMNYDLADIEKPRHISRPKSSLIVEFVPKLLRGLPMEPHQPVAFSYRGKTIRVGTGLEEDDTKQLLALLRKYCRRE